MLCLKTADYVRKHGFKAEIELKVKQANNKLFSFLFEQSRLHGYYEFLKRGEHELSTRERFLKASARIQKQIERKLNQEGKGGALAALGQYGSDDSSSESGKEEKDEKKS